MKPKRAVALRYLEERDRAPRVVAKGAGDVAKALLSVAEKENVAIVENQPLVDALMQLEIEDVIPQELYQAVAEILAFVYRTGQ
jgi:flagellar biosynthesis protein